MPHVGAERWVGFVVSEFDENGRWLVMRRERVHRQFAEPSAEIDQIVGRDVLIAKDEELVLDQRVKDHIEGLVGEALAKVDAPDLGAEISPHAGYGDAVLFHGNGSAPPGVCQFVHELPPLNFVSYCGSML